MKLTLILLLFSFSSLAQVRNCDIECPTLFQRTESPMAYEQYQARQACLRNCEETNRQEEQIESQREEIKEQEERLEEQREMLEEQQTIIKQHQDQLNDLSTRP